MTASISRRRVTRPATPRVAGRPGPLGTIAAAWGVGSLILLLAFAVGRLAPIARESVSQQLEWHHWAALVLNAGFMAYAEGYRGFQRGMAPRIIGRAAELAHSPSIARTILAPAYCYGVIDAPTRQVIARISLMLMVIAFIMAVRALSPPWRGLLDVGVILGLSWGIVSICAQGWLALTTFRGSLRDGCGGTAEVEGKGH